jgi:hypothetical protein
MTEFFVSFPDSHIWCKYMRESYVSDNYVQDNSNWDNCG